MKKVCITAEITVDTNDEYEAQAAAQATVQGYPSTVIIPTRTGSRSWLGKKEINILKTRISYV